MHMLQTCYQKFEFLRVRFGQSTSPSIHVFELIRTTIQGSILCHQNIEANRQLD